MVAACGDTTQRILGVVSGAPQDCAGRRGQPERVASSQTRGSADLESGSTDSSVGSTTMSAAATPQTPGVFKPRNERDPLLSRGRRQPVRVRECADSILGTPEVSDRGRPHQTPGVYKPWNGAPHENAGRRGQPERVASAQTRGWADLCLLTRLRLQIGGCDLQRRAMGH